MVVVIIQKDKYASWLINHKEPAGCNSGEVYIQWNCSISDTMKKFHARWLSNKRNDLGNKFYAVYMTNSGEIRSKKEFTESRTLGEICERNDYYEVPELKGAKKSLTVGDRVVIINDVCSHRIPIGTIITLVDTWGDSGNRFLNDYNKSYVTLDDIAVVHKGYNAR